MGSRVVATAARRSAFSCFLLLLLGLATPTTATPWQAWIAAGGGPGGEYAGGGLLGAEAGGRVGVHSVSAHMFFSVSNILASSVRSTGELALLYGYQLQGGDLAVDLQAGPTLVNGDGDDRFLPGLQLGLHLQLRPIQGIGLGMRPYLEYNHRGNYLGLMFQLELGKLR